jgi:hypothetical protein
MVGILGMLAAPILIGGGAFTYLAIWCRKKSRNGSGDGR